MLIKYGLLPKIFLYVFFSFCLLKNKILPQNVYSIIMKLEIFQIFSAHDNNNYNL